jgi:hypothetical protein
MPKESGRAERTRMRLPEILWRLETAFETMAPIRGHLENDTQEDTAFVMGNALGVLADAISKVKRDMKANKEAADE